MEETFTGDEIIHAFDALPDVVKEAIVDIPIPEIVKSIGEKYNLHVDVTGTIYSEINLITIGLRDRDVLRTKLLSSANFPKEHIDDVMHDINEEIFNPLREAVISYREIEDEVMSESKEGKPEPVAGVEYLEKEVVENKDMEEGVDLRPKEEQILKESGIEIGDTLSQPKSLTEISLADIKMPESAIRHMVKLSQSTLEPNPPVDGLPKAPTYTPTTSKGIIEEKMSGSFGMKKETTDHSLPLVGSEKKVASGGDLYREPI